MFRATKIKFYAVLWIIHSCGASSPPDEGAGVADAANRNDTSDVILSAIESGDGNGTFPLIRRNVTTVNSSTSVNGSDIPELCGANDTCSTYTLDPSDYAEFGLTETAGVVAVGFLLFAVAGYIGFVLWRRYLQNKYSNGQTLIDDDVYDISDLRNFEI